MSLQIRKYLFLLFAILALAIAGLSIADMFFQKPYDGVTSSYQNGTLKIVEIAPGSPATLVNLRQGDIILGIAHQIVKYPSDAATVLMKQKIGQTIPYLIQRGNSIFTVPLTLGKYRLANTSYYYYAIIGLIFFLVGLLVFLFKSEDAAARLFFLMSTSFFLFLVCSLRPHSYYWVDWFVHSAGMFSLFLLPAFFLHFFLIFPQPKIWLVKHPKILYLVYLLPALSFLPDFFSYIGKFPIPFILKSWLSWALLVIYFTLGILSFSRTFLKATDFETRRKLRVILWGVTLGLVPFLIFGVILGSLLGNTHYLLIGVIPMVFVPISFAYAIIRFQLMDIDILINKSVVYTLTTFVISLLYVILIATVDALTSFTRLANSPVLPFVLALLIVYFFNPLRDRIQTLVDRTFFKERYDYRKTMDDISEAIISILKLDELLNFLTKKLKETLRVRHVSIAVRNAHNSDFQIFSEETGNHSNAISQNSSLVRFLESKRTPIRKSDLQPYSSNQVLLEELGKVNSELVIPLFYENQLIGSINLGGRLENEPFGKEDIQLLKTLGNQTAIAIENATLHQRLTHQAEITRDLKIASEMQNHLLPTTHPSIQGIQILTHTIPAQEVGGDFYDFIEITRNTNQMGITIGDVSAKSISGAIAMVAAKEIIHSEARDHQFPSEVLRESSERLYGLLEKNVFITLFYGLLDMRELTLRYSCAGHPLPFVVRSEEKTVFQLDKTDIRFPLGPIQPYEYDEKSISLKQNDILCFYTDGLTEAMNTEGDLFGDERLRAVLLNHANGSLAQLKASVLDEVTSFLNGNAQGDDITLVLLKIANTEWLH